MTPQTKNVEDSVILLVEDNEDHAELIRHCFVRSRRNTRIVHVADGDDALDYLNHQGRYTDHTVNPQPDVVILDLRLPKTDGLEVLKQIRTSSDLHGMPVVILTTSDSQIDVAAAYDNGANSYLIKPLGFQELSNMVSDLGSYWLGWNHPRNSDAGEPVPPTEF
jgi:DNA-binding response OmpR family regulator